MNQCRVLRCSNPAAHVLNLNPMGDLPLETVVCQEHHDQIQSGAHWRFDAEEDAVLVGDDIAVAGMRRVTKFVGFTNDLSTIASGGGALLRFEYEDGEALSFLASPEVLDQLGTTARLFSWGTDPFAQSGSDE